MIKKGECIELVCIDHDNVIAISKNNDSVKLTRTQRKLFTTYNNPEFLDKIYKEFSRPTILADNFTITKNGKVVYSL